MGYFVLKDCHRINGLTGESLEMGAFARLSQIDVHGVKNEYVSFQIVLEDVSIPYENIKFRFEPSGGQAGIGQEGFSVFYEWFHQFDGKLIPDMLVPWEHAGEIGLTAKTREYYTSRYTAFWVDCFIPKTIEAGAYTGTVYVDCGGDAIAIPYAVTVHKATLCDEALIHTDCNNYADAMTRIFPEVLANNEKRFEDGSYFKIESQFYKMTHDHRALFHYLPYTHSGFNYISFAPKLAGEGKTIHVSDWSLYDEHMGPYFDGSAFKGTARGEIPVPFAYLPFCFDWPSSYEKWGTEGYKIENRRILLDFLRHFEEKGWTKTVFEIFSNHKKRYRFFPYDGDETRHEHDEEFFYIFDDIFTDLLNQSNVQVVIRTDSSWSFHKQYNSRMSEIIKMWTVGGGLILHVPESFQYMKEQGNILWAYGGLPQLNDRLVALYEWPIRCLQNEIGGILYWNTTGIGPEPLVCPTSGGGETFYYPTCGLGLPGGLFPSLRLKFNRNTMQLVDLVKMYEGTWTYHQMRDAIDEIYGNTRDKWHHVYSEEMRCEPHLMTNEMIGRNCNNPANNASRNATPDTPLQVKAKILEMADSFLGGQSVWR